MFMEGSFGSSFGSINISLFQEILLLVRFHDLMTIPNSKFFFLSLRFSPGWRKDKFVSSREGEYGGQVQSSQFLSRIVRSGLDLRSRRSDKNMTAVGPIPDCFN